MKLIKIGKKIKHCFNKRFLLHSVLLLMLIALITLGIALGEKKIGSIPRFKFYNKPDISSFGLEIAKINVWAPIIPQVDGYDKNVYLKMIENGVAQFKDTRNPNELGNLFIFGHSKYYRNKPGNYKEVFGKLNLLTQGDEFNVYYKGKKIKYEVTESKRVDEYDWSIMDPTPDDPSDKTITIMTCWPPGTLDARWAVFGIQK